MGIDKVCFHLTGLPGTGKQKILNLLEYTLFQKGYSPYGKMSPSVYAETKALVECDIREHRLLKKIRVVTDRLELLDPVERTTLVLWIQTPLSYSICAEIYLEVIAPTITAIEGLEIECNSTLQNHLSNPAIFPLREIEWSTQKAYFPKETLKVILTRE